MAEPNTPGEARKQGLRKSRWVAVGAAVGAAAFLTGIIAGVNGADGNGIPTQPISSTNGGVQSAPRSDDGYSSDDDKYESDDEYESDDQYESDGDDDERPFTPQQPSGSSGSSSGSTQQVPSFTPQPQTRSGGS